MDQQSFGVVPVMQVNGELKFLVVRHNVGHWSFPKGHPEAGETEVESALRELREETGISEVELAPDWFALERYHFKGHDRGERINKTVKYFLGLVKSPQVTLLEEELQDYRWVNEAEAKRLISFPAGRRVLDQAIARLGQS